MRGAWKAILLLALVGPPISAALVVPIDHYQARVQLVGYDDAIPRPPAAGTRDIAGTHLNVLPTVTSGCIATSPCAIAVPQAQYTWFDLDLHDLDGRPVASALVHGVFRGFEGGADNVTLQTDATGHARVLRRPATLPAVEAHLTYPDGSFANFTWLVSGTTVNATQPTIIRGEGRLVEATITFSKLTNVWLDEHANVIDASRSNASALVSDFAVFREGTRVFGEAAYGAFSDGRDAELAVTPPGFATGTDVPVDLSLLRTSQGTTVDMRGDVATNITVVATVGRTGDGADAFLRVFGDPRSVRITLRDVGPLVVASPNFTGVQATALAAGLVAGDTTVRLNVTQAGLVMTDASAFPISLATATFARNASGRAVTLTTLAVPPIPLARAGAYFLDDGVCTGAWTVALPGYVGLGAPSAAIAHAPGYSLPSFARGVFPALGVCS